MKKLLIFGLAAFVLAFSSAFTLKKNDRKPVYVFGVSASFTDTVVYFTDIQLLDSVWLDKNDFLPGRDLYSYQLKNYLEGVKGLENRVCMIYFSESLKKLKKESAKVMGKYRKNGGYALRNLPKDDFQFKKVDVE